MSTTTRPPKGAALVALAYSNVTGFSDLFRLAKRRMKTAGRSDSTLHNYTRHLAQMPLHFNTLQTECEVDHILAQVLWWRIRKKQVLWLLHRMLQQHATKGITLHNDNGSQFIAHAVRNFLQEKQIAQEFTHVATPEENCFIEAFHSILDKQLLQTTGFQDIEEAIAAFHRWRTFYIEHRRHGSLG